eukprot:scpid23518/ scgid24348/ Epithelial discoidin domain-containing receptor 1; CD167 antigen-like family member A; Discoidin receptor tyrosine kinase; Tyrosine kinase DDR
MHGEKMAAGYGITLLVLTSIICVASTLGEEVPCPAELLVCESDAQKVVRTFSYTMPQGMHTGRKSNRSYEDETYSPNHRNQHQFPWAAGNSLVWLSGGRGQLTDSACGTDDFRLKADRYPWVGWNTLNIVNESGSTPVPIYFEFQSSVSLASVKLATLNPRQSGVALFDFVSLSISTTDVVPYDQKTWVTILNSSAEADAYTNTSSPLTITLPVSQVYPNVKYARLEIGPSSYLTEGGSVHPWILISEVVFCANDFTRQSIALASQSTVTLVESEEGRIPCTGDNVDLLELIRSRDGAQVSNVTALTPNRLSIDYTILEPKQPVDAGGYLCKGSNSLTPTSTSTISVNVLPALDIFRTTNVTVASGSSVLLQCCSHDNRQHTVSPPVLWDWLPRQGQTVSPLAEDSPLPYIIVTDIQPGTFSYSCVARLGGAYTDYSGVAMVTVTDTISPGTGDNSHNNILVYDACSRSVTTSTAPQSEPSVTPAASASASAPASTSTSPPQSSASTSSGFGAVAAVLLVCFIICFACLILVLFVLWRRRQQQRHEYRHKHLPSNSLRHLRSDFPVKTNARQAGLSPEHRSPRSSNTSPIGSSARSHAPSVSSIDGSNTMHVQSQLESSLEYADPQQLKREVHHPYGTTSVSSLPTPLGPKALNQAVYASVQTPDQLKIYAEPDQVCPTPGSAKFVTNHIYEEAVDINPEKMLQASALESASAVKEKRLSRLVPLYEEPPPLPREEGPPLLDPTKLIYSEKDKIGEGQFGDVYRAQLLTDPPQDVAVKTLKMTEDKDLCKSFEKEVKFMSRQKHNHVVRLLGICDSNGLTAMVMENMSNGDLHSYLSKRELNLKPRQTLPAKKYSVTLAVLVRMMQQVASGMEYLSERAYVHRDLAARNCLVASDLTVKLGDFGLTCHLYDRLYYRVAGKAVLPLQWMAPESFYGNFSVQTDVFSFGIACWEILTMCEAGPFADIEPSELIRLTVRCRNEGTDRPTPEIPDYSPAGIRELLTHCWKMNGADRPSFQHLNAELKKIAVLLRS